MNIITQFGSHQFHRHRQNRYTDNFGQLRSSTERIIRGDGGVDQFGTGRIPGAIGEVAITLWLDEADGLMRDQLDNIRALGDFGRTTLSMLPTLGTEIRTTSARSTQVNYIQRVDGVPHRRQEVEMLWEVPDPFWYSPSRRLTLINATGLATAGTGTTTGTQRVFPVIKVTPTGTLAFVEIQRLASGSVVEKIRYAPSAGFSDVLTIDCPGTEMKVGNVIVYTTDLTYQRGHWFSCVRGENNFNIVLPSSGSAATVEITYQPKWR